MCLCLASSGDVNDMLLTEELNPQNSRDSVAFTVPDHTFTSGEIRLVEQ